MWEYIFRILSYISIFNIIRKIRKTEDKTTYRFVDYWVVGNFLFSIISSVFVFYYNGDLLYIMIVLSVYGSLRVFEVIIYQINVVIFDPYRAYKAKEKYKIKSIRRMIIALFHNYVEIMFWYATSNHCESFTSQYYGHMV